MFEQITLENKNDIYYLGFGKGDESSLTIITKTTLEEMKEALEKVSNDKAAKGLILHSHKPECFLAGMDVKVINTLSSEVEAIEGCEFGQSVFNQIEDLKVPTMALVDGVCLGGGLEMVLACDKIMISDNKKTALGVPEVMLGVLPGFGGTYRLPKKIGLTVALPLILSGKQTKAKKALKIGLADYMMPSSRMMSFSAEYLLKKNVDKKSLQESLTDAASENFIARSIIFRKARQSVLELTKGFYPAPLKILDHLENSFGKRRATYLSNEAKAFAELSQTSQSKALQHVFFLNDNAKKLDGKKNIASVKHGAVLGGGTMGGGIAWLMAKNDQAPILKDINTTGLELGLKQSATIFGKAVKRRRMSVDNFQRAQRSIKPTLSYSGFKRVDLAIEAVVEVMDIKKSVLTETEKHVDGNALITTNTSSLSVNEMAKALEDSSRFAGLHFFNPVNKMPLVEIVRHKNVSDETIKRLYKWVLDVKKTPVVVNDCPGFLVNRILGPFCAEAVHMLEEGVPIDDIDKAILNFGMPMGACRLMDEIGLDVCEHVAKILSEGLGSRFKPSELSAKFLEAELLGRKNSEGFYLYDEAGKETGINPKMEALLPKKKIKLDETTIQMRLFLIMINEASHILDEKIVETAADVDLGLIFGIGFPPFRGGLMRYADNEGLNRIVTAIERFSEEVDSDRYCVSPFLKQLAENKKKFYEI